MGQPCVLLWDFCIGNVDRWNNMSDNKKLLAINNETGERIEFDVEDIEIETCNLIYASDVVIDI